MIYRKDKIPEDLQQFFVRAEIGLEESPTEYVNQMVDVFREVRRVLRPDGTLWVNLGDSYIGGGRAGKNPEYHARHTMFGKTSEGAETSKFGLPMKIPEGMKAKDLAGIPWRFAFALQADGWYLRNDIIWAKPSPMPEPAKDRFTRAHEYVFLFAHPQSKGRYFYDQDAVRLPIKSTNTGEMRIPEQDVDKLSENFKDPMKKDATLSRDVRYAEIKGANGRTVWTVGNQPYAGAHFAVWPPALVEPMVRAGTSAHGVCASCGAPWKRVSAAVQTEPDLTQRTTSHYNTADRYGAGNGGNTGFDKFAAKMREGTHGKQTVGWEPTCECVDPGPPVPATVLDPFSGSATTGMVALAEGRNYIGCDINPEFLELAVARVEGRAAPAKGDAAVTADVLDFFNLD